MPIEVNPLYEGNGRDHKIRLKNRIVDASLNKNIIMNRSNNKYIKYIISTI